MNLIVTIPLAPWRISIEQFSWYLATMTSIDTAHKSRQKKKGSGPLASASNNTVVTDSKTNSQVPAFPLVAFFWPARKSTSQWVILPLILMVVGLFRWSAGFWGYSGSCSRVRTRMLTDSQQASTSLLFMVTLRLKDIGWR